MTGDSLIGSMGMSSEGVNADIDGGTGINNSAPLRVQPAPLAFDLKEVSE